MKLQRDVFIQVILEAARKDRDIMFLSADFGSEILDTYRAELPDQFIHCGISEQHMIDLAAGLSLAGKKVYVYCMGPFLSLRCYEQIKCAIDMMSLPVTLIGVGVGLGYADSGPTHYVTEDIACLRALNGIELYTLADNDSAIAAAELSLASPAFRYFRLDRSPMPNVYAHVYTPFSQYDNLGFNVLADGKDVCILSSGYMLHRCLEAYKRLAVEGIKPGIIDLYCIKPFDEIKLNTVLQQYDAIITVEEQGLSGGFGSAIIESLIDSKLQVKNVTRMGLSDHYFFENGGRDFLLDTELLSVGDIVQAVRDVRK